MQTSDNPGSGYSAAVYGWDLEQIPRTGQFRRMTRKELRAFAQGGVRKMSSAASEVWVLAKQVLPIVCDDSCFVHAAVLHVKIGETGVAFVQLEGSVSVVLPPVGEGEEATYGLYQPVGRVPAVYVS